MRTCDALIVPRLFDERPSAPVDGAFALDGDIIGTVGKDELDGRRLSAQRDIIGAHGGVVAEPRAAIEGGATVEMQRHMRAERETAGNEIARRHDDPPTTRRRATVDGLLDGIGTEHCGVGTGAEIEDVVVSRMDESSHDAKGKKRDGSFHGCKNTNKE